MDHLAQTELMSMFHDAVRGGFVQVPSLGNNTDDSGCLDAAPVTAPTGEGAGLYTTVEGSGRDDSFGSAHTVRADMRGVCTISADDARAIFLAKKDRRSRDHLATRLAQEFNITPKAVRDIWTLRTWFKATKELWSAEDTEKFLKKTLCAGCRNCGFASMQQACPTRCGHRHARHPRKTSTALVQSSSGRPAAQDQRFAHVIHAAPEESGLVMAAHNKHDQNPTANDLLIGQRPMVTEAPAPLPDSSIKHGPRFEGTWLLDPALVARDFEELLFEWHATLSELNHENART